MPVVLAVLSFILTVFLAVFLVFLLRQPTVNIPSTALALWLLVANGVHAVNALVWAGNTLPRIPVWCDIVTKLIVGAIASLPGACLCAARALELLASRRKHYPNTYSRRIHALLDAGLCYVLPLLYMILRTF
ncbi:STE3-like pheromone receptor, partial [Mycena pura]